MPLLAHLRRSLRRLGCASDAKLVVAVSGGADSLCLLHLLVRLRPELALTLHVAHLDHGLRGAHSAADAAFVAAMAEQWGVAATVERRPVAPVAAALGLGTQAAARRVRYAFLADVAQAVQANVVAVAHNADDQAETVLLHLLRGAGLAGLRGMRPLVPWDEWATFGQPPDEEAASQTTCSSNRQQVSEAHLVRPLLDVPRAAIDAYCTTHGLAPRHDPSNASPTYARTQVRHTLLPQLTAYNSDIVAALGRTARAAADDYAFLQAALDEVWPQLARSNDGTVRLDLALLQGLHPALRRAALRRAVELLLGRGVALGFEHLEAAHEAVLRGPGAHLGLPYGLQLDVVHGAVALSIGALAATDAVPQLLHAMLTLPDEGRAALGGGWWVTVGSAPKGGRWAAGLDADALAGPLRLRQRRAGDRIRPLGGRGSRRVQDLFVDRKVPREQRGAWPILVMGDQPIWVVGLALDARVAATSPTARRLWVVFEREDEQIAAASQAATT
jgi:tRNA(Ile)-lysidine synthetase-like protein